MCWHQLLRTLGQQKDIVTTNRDVVFLAENQNRSRAGRVSGPTPDSHSYWCMYNSAWNEIFGIVGHKPVGARVGHPLTFS